MAGPLEPTYLEWVLRRGQPLVRSIRFPDGVDLTGYEPHLRIRSYPDADTIHFDLPPTDWPIDDGDGPGAAVWIDDSGPLVVSRMVFWLPQAPIDALEPFATNGTEPFQRLTKWGSVMVAPPDKPASCWFEGRAFIVPGDPA